MKKTILLVIFFIIGVIASWLGILFFAPSMNIELAFIITLGSGIALAFISLIAKKNS